MVVGTYPDFSVREAYPIFSAPDVRTVVEEAHESAPGWGLVGFKERRTRLLTVDR